MSTESLFHNFVIDKKEDAERFVEAILLSEQDPPFVSSGKCRRITDPDELAELCDRIFARAIEDGEKRDV